MSIKKALFGGGVETNATASYQGSIQDWLPVKNIIGGVVITKDNRFIKILEIVPVNIYLKSAEDRQAIVEAFAAYLKIAPDHMQFEARTLPADISRYVERMQEYAKNEDNAYCRDMIQDNIQDIGMGVASNALQHRFFMVEVLKCALLEIDTGMRSLHMTATNMEVTLRQDVPLLAYEGGDTTFAIDAKLLSAMLANLPGNTVECCKGDKDTLALSSDHAYYQVPTASGKGFPRMNITAPESMVKLSGVPSMVRRAAFATDPNNSNMPLLRCVNLRLTSDGLRAVGSDGVCIVSAKGDKQCTGDQTFLIPAANLEKLAQLCEEKDTFSVGMADRQLVFVKEGFQFAARLMHGSYVDTDSLIAGTQNTFTVLSDSEELRRTLQTATAACMDNRTILHFDGNRLTLRCTGEVGSSNAALTVIPLTGQPFGDYCFAVDRLERCLRALRGTVTLGIAQTGMLTLSTEDAFYMQTQLRMTASKAKSARKKAAKAA